MENKKNMHVKDTDVISASEIGQYHFCSKAWHLQRCGYEPKSPMLEIGTKKHIELGRVVDYTQTNIKRYRAFAIAGYLILFFGILLLLFGVIL
jgi:hypothetical protein